MYIYFDYIGIEVESILEYFQHQIVKQKHNSDKNTKNKTRIYFILASKWSPITEYFQHHIANTNITVKRINKKNRIYVKFNNDIEVESNHGVLPTPCNTATV